jgi:ferredoxin
MTVHFTIGYLSPNGSTRDVAQALAGQLSQNGASVSPADLSDPGERRALMDAMCGDDPVCLLIGSPVYRSLAVPPVMAFIDTLPETEHAWAVPFVTYGKACSGVALWQMAMALQDKGFQIAAAAKVVAVHSLMWQSEHPEAEGRPNADDLQQVRRLADLLLSQFSTGTPTALVPDALDYQPEALAAECKSAIGQPWMNIPKTVDGDACTACGICVDVCPADAIALNPGPEFGSDCFDCFNCIRLCPEDAIALAVSLADLEVKIRSRVESINEQPLTQVFVGE